MGGTRKRERSGRDREGEGRRGGGEAEERGGKLKKTRPTPFLFLL